MSFIDLFFINGTRCYVTYYSCYGLALIVRSVRTYGVLLHNNTTYKLSFALITMAFDHKLID